jgi:XrtN system VIT domain protein
MNPFTPKTTDKLSTGGWLAILLSLAFLCLPVVLPHSANSEALFICNYVIAVAYFICLLVSGRLRKGREGLYPFLLFLILFLISAYALNRQMVVFEKATTWFVVLQVILCANFVAIAFIKESPRWLQFLMTFLLGVALITFLYLACYLFPLYGLSALISFVLGVSLHSFVAVLFIIYILVLFKKVASGNKVLVRSFISGAGLSLAIVIIYVVQWAIITHTINTSYRRATVSENDGLPAWVSVAQQAPRSWFTEKILKADLVYSVAGKWDDFFWRVPTRNFEEERKHDPLIMIATFFAGKVNLSEDTRIRLLESMYDSRHQAQERLWSGNDLYTEHINTAVRIWPQYGIAYTEKAITVSNAAMHENLGGTEQEAIYTFHMPEGAVVTSLSLWIDGKESPAVLTTKQKADSAYKEIVGRERHDPSVLHWQEGNTVSVRVFPVVAGESRKFKVGITAPLGRENGRMKYENIYFDGPTVADATEAITLQFQQAPQNFIAPAVFTPKGQQSFARSGRYDPSWNIELPDQPLSADAFCFNGKQYTVRPYQKVREAAHFKTVYLDVNRSWTKSEFDSVYNLVKHKQVFVYNNELVQVTDHNRESLFGKLHKYQFGLFPLFLIQDANTSLLISKSNNASPNVNDLEGSRFLASLKQSMHEARTIKLFNIGSTLSPYLKTLKEFRAFQYEHGTVNDLNELINKQVFAKNVEHNGQVVIDNAEVAIEEKDCTQPAAAPDHLMRLFTYNHIMQEMGAGLLTGKEADPTLVAEAQKAYVVSPVSSLVVLETQKDYERFNIKDGENSLKNASMKSKGAVPEPHEWALIIIAVGVIVFIKFRPVKKNLLS